MFVVGVVGVSDRHAEEITKHARGFFEGYFVLAEILVCFDRIPLKHHAFSIASLLDYNAGLTELPPRRREA